MKYWNLTDSTIEARSPIQRITTPYSGHPTETCIEGLLIDEDAADQVWEDWDAKLISDELAASAWLLVATVVLVPDTRCEPG